MNPASIAVEATKVANGRSTVSELGLYCFVAVTVEAFFKLKERDEMFDTIYIPAGYEMVTFIILIACAIVFPVITGWFFKNESRHAGEKWIPRYYATLLIDMCLTPAIGLIAMSLFTEAFFPEISPLTYEVFLFIILMAVSYLTLKVLNEGIKATVEQVKGVAKEAADAVTELKK